MYYEKTDLRIDGPLPLEFVRRYDSKSTYDGVMGYGWQHSFMVRLDALGFGPVHVFFNEDMRIIRFNSGCSADSNASDCSDQWQPNTMEHMTLT